MAICASRQYPYVTVGPSYFAAFPHSSSFGVMYQTQRQNSKEVTKSGEVSLLHLKAPELEQQRTSALGVSKEIDAEA